MFSKLAFLALLASASATPLRRTGYSLKVTTEAPSTADSLEKVWVVTTLTNTGSQTIDVNPYDTVFSSPQTNDFDVVRDGSKASGNGRAAFVGFIAKHVTDVATLRKLEKLKTLAPGESISSNDTLAGRYDLTSSGAGLYKISAKPKFEVAPHGGEKFETVQADVHPASVRITGALGRTRTRRVKRDIKYEGCSAERQAAIELAAVNAQAGSEAALAHLEEAGGDEIFTQWFGTPSDDAIATVSLHYENMNGLFSDVTYDCSYCEAETGTFAQVQPDDISTIYLCGYYWEATACGTDSQQGTLIHEASHFTAIAATDDIAYGQEDAALLASSTPAQALMNADNHEYYEEAVYTQCSSSA